MERYSTEDEKIVVGCDGQDILCGMEGGIHRLPEIINAVEVLHWRNLLHHPASDALSPHLRLDTAGDQIHLIPCINIKHLELPIIRPSSNLSAKMTP